VASLRFFCITSLFILCQDYFLLTDYPNYLARIYLYNNLSDAHPLSEYYFKNMKITPYMGFPVIVGLLEPLVGIYWAGKYFFVFALSLIISGGVYLNYILHKAVTPFSLFLHLFIFNLTFSMGFMNFTLGLGLILWGFGLWIRYQRHNIKFYSVFALYGIFVFFCHIFALFLLGLLIGFYQLSLYPRSTIKLFLKSALKSALKVISFTLVPMIITPFIMITDMGFPPITSYVGFFQHFNFIVISPIFFTKNIGAFILIGAFGLLIFSKQLTWKLSFALKMLLCIALITPFFLLSVAYVNIRIPALLGLLFAICCTFKTSKKSFNVVMIVTVIFSIQLYATNIQKIFFHNDIISEFVNTIKDDSQLKQKKLLTVTDSDALFFGPTVDLHLSSYAVIETNMFVPEMMTSIPPINTNQKYQHIDIGIGGVISRDILNMTPEDAFKVQHILTKITGYSFYNYWKKWRQEFDYVLWLHPKGQPENIPKELYVYKQGSYFTIYKIIRKNK